MAVEDYKLPDTIENLKRMKNLILIPLLLLMNTYYSQSLKDFDLNTKTLDISVFNENKTQYDYDFPGGIHIFQFITGRGITERITRKYDPYTIDRAYYPNGKVKYVTRFFYRNVIISKSFTEEGKLIEERNSLPYYPFTINDLIHKMKKEYNIDLSVKFTTPYFLHHDVSMGHSKSSKDTIAQYRVTVNLLFPYAPVLRNGKWEEERKQVDTLYRDGGIVKEIRYYIDGKTGETFKTEEKVFMKEVRTIELPDKLPHTISRIYEMDGKGEIMQITEYKRYPLPPAGYDELIREDEEKVIYQKPGYKEGAFKIHKGKAYTQEEWLRFEQLELEDYAKKHDFKLSEAPKTQGKFFLDERQEGV